mmetsp:Transcript_41046/g.72164  ORF Transcript_41046/g.72164 Transcript_41046/m.72164 type:complete len:139 (-) Transcript_41046:68-484(-)
MNIMKYVQLAIVVAIISTFAAVLTGCYVDGGQWCEAGNCYSQSCKINGTETLWSGVCKSKNNETLCCGTQNQTNMSYVPFVAVAAAAPVESRRDTFSLTSSEMLAVMAGIACGVTATFTVITVMSLRRRILQPPALLG